MTTTPYIDLHSEDILSAHISALQHSINKLETVLDLITTSKVNQLLTAVSDQTDSSMQYKIYEGVDRNWLTSPVPVIKRDGSVVAASEYTLKAAQGAIVFKTKQSPTAVITADFTMITGNSNVINTLVNDVSNHTNSIASNTVSISSNTSDLAVLKPFTSPHIIGTYKSHNLTGGYATGVNAVLIASNAMDAFPFPVYKTTTYDKMMININTVSGTKMILGVYSDNGNLWPSSLLAKTSEIDVTTTGIKESTFTSGDLTLQPGMYWLARWQDGAPKIDYGVQSYSAISLGETSDLTMIDSVQTASIGGIRTTVTYDSIMRTTFPSFTGTTKYLKRTAYGSPWIRRKS